MSDGPTQLYPGQGDGGGTLLFPVSPTNMPPPVYGAPPTDTQGGGHVIIPVAHGSHSRAHGSHHTRSHSTHHATHHTHTSHARTKTPGKHNLPHGEEYQPF